MIRFAISRNNQGDIMKTGRPVKAGAALDIAETAGLYSADEVQEATGPSNGEATPESEADLTDEPAVSDAGEGEAVEHVISPDDPELLQLEARFTNTYEAFNRDAVLTSIRLGALLFEVRALLGDQLWTWTPRLSVSRTALQRYMALADLSASRPDLIRDWKALGVYKLYYVHMLAPDHYDLVLRRTRKAELLRMNDAQFRALVDQYLPEKPPSTAPVAFQPGRVVRNLKTSAGQLESLRAHVAEHPEKEVPPAVLEAFLALKQEVNELSTLFVRPAAIN